MVIAGMVDTEHTGIFDAKQCQQVVELILGGPLGSQTSLLQSNFKLWLEGELKNSIDIPTKKFEELCANTSAIKKPLLSLHTNMRGKLLGG